MARGKRGKRAENHSDFAGPDANQEAIETLSRAAAKKNKGSNQGPVSDEAMLRHIELIQAAELEYDEARDVTAQRSGVLRNRYKVAKNDGVDIEALKLALKLAKRTSGEVVTEHRNVGRIIRLMNLPIGHQFDLFKVAGDDEAEEAGKPSAMDAELQGQHAYSNSEPLTNNPFHPAQDTERYNDWRSGWINAQNANARTMAARGDSEPAAAA